MYFLKKINIELNKMGNASSKKQTKCKATLSSYEDLYDLPSKYRIDDIFANIYTESTGNIIVSTNHRHNIVNIIISSNRNTILAKIQVTISPTTLSFSDISAKSTNIVNIANSCIRTSNHACAKARIVLSSTDVPPEYSDTTHVVQNVYMPHISADPVIQNTVSDTDISTVSVVQTIIPTTDHNVTLATSADAICTTTVSTASVKHTDSDTSIIETIKTCSDEHFLVYMYMFNYFIYMDSKYNPKLEFDRYYTGSDKIFITNETTLLEFDVAVLDKLKSNDTSQFFATFKYMLNNDNKINISIYKIYPEYSTKNSNMHYIFMDIVETMYIRYDIMFKTSASKVIVDTGKYLTQLLKTNLGFKCKKKHDKLKILGDRRYGGYYNYFIDNTKRIKYPDLTNAYDAFMLGIIKALSESASIFYKIRDQ
jgi:hypothetical protein